TLKSTAPLIQTSGGSNIVATGSLFFTRRGIWFRPPTTGDNSSFETVYCEGCITPTVWGGSTVSAGSGLLGGSGDAFTLSITTLTQDTSFLPAFVGLGNLIGTVAINATNSLPPVTSGNGSHIIYTMYSGSYRSGGTSFANDGTFGRAQNSYSNEIHNLGMQLGTGYSFF